MSMVKSFILYSEVEIEDNVVDCVYLVKDECRAQPFVGSDKEYFKPNEKDRAKFCNRGFFTACPRFNAYQRHLEIIGLKEKTTNKLLERKSLPP
jgi:hypothetical protein